MKNLFLIIVIALFAFSCTTTVVTTNGPTPSETFKKTDKDNNGFINRKEADMSSNASLKQNFKKIDKNNDGRVSLREYKRHR